MKKNITIAFALLATILMICSCSKDTEGLTRITYYPTLTLEGDNYITVEKGSTYTDSGCTAVLNGEDISDKLDVKNTVDTSKSGVYTVTYTATNADNFSKSITRTVYVLDSSDPIEGFYMVSADSYRDRGGTITVYGDTYDVLVINSGESDNNGTIYTFEDILGGYYSQRAGYGSSYNLSGDVSISANGNLTLNSSLIPGWGDGADALTGTCDAASGIITMQTTYASMDFYVTMIKY